MPPKGLHLGGEDEQNIAVCWEPVSVSHGSLRWLNLDSPQFMETALKSPQVTSGPRIGRNKYKFSLEENYII